MKTYPLQKIIFLLVAGLLFIDISLKAQSATNQSSLRLEESVNSRSLPGNGNFALPSELPGNYNGDWI